MLTFICDKKDIDSEQFSLDSLKILSKNTGVKIVVRDYATIINGIMTIFCERLLH